MPGMKWSTPLVVESIGIRVTAVQATPSVEVLMTMSFAVQPDLNRQSCQTTYTLPDPSISADGSGGSRRPAATLCWDWLATSTGLDHDAPPSVERNARIEP